MQRFQRVPVTHKSFRILQLMYHMMFEYPEVVSDGVYMMLDPLNYLYVRASLSNAEDGRIIEVQRPELGSLYLREESRLARGIAPGWLT